MRLPKMGTHATREPTRVTGSVEWTVPEGEERERVVRQIMALNHPDRTLNGTLQRVVLPSPDEPITSLPYYDGPIFGTLDEAVQQALDANWIECMSPISFWQEQALGTKAYREGRGGRVMTQKHSPLGDGVYILPGLVKHSSVPNCSRFCLGDTMFVYSTEPIPAGTELGVHCGFDCESRMLLTPAPSAPSPVEALVSDIHDGYETLVKQTYSLQLGFGGCSEEEYVAQVDSFLPLLKQLPEKTIPFYIEVILTAARFKESLATHYLRESYALFFHRGLRAVFKDDEAFRIHFMGWAGEKMTNALPDIKDMLKTAFNRGKERVTYDMAWVRQEMAEDRSVTKAVSIEAMMRKAKSKPAPAKTQKAKRGQGKSKANRRRRK
ncbi:hypothetical protein KIPB_002628 [Kipferlia bialata]|uniref:SET domain-containing protein n=1 Tax=Kipferlia bialata TaxID=797122 RepID=A0A9K3CT42_9EUKA|nr:hypothetical protein KIPB_002628 [Kipferlia bialata]|eukprot:g2628.t1